jgi:hypothetical protein
VDVPEVSIGFAPQPGPQSHFVYCPYDIVVYGGARGGGKTYATLGEFWIHAETYGHAAKGLMIRRTREDLKDTRETAVEMFGNAARWQDKGSMFRFKSGAILYLAYLESDDDATHYQGWSLTRVYVEEITQFPNQAPILKLLATLRSKLGIRCQFRATCNPGGPGHHWVKAWVIDNGPYTPYRDPETGLSRCFIPARVGDNPALLEGDPNYVARLKSAGSAQLVRAWLEGDWNVIEGAFFPEWSEERHVVPNFSIPAYWTRFRAGDWGSARPFSFGWYAVVQDDFPVGDGRTLPRSAVVRYREYYGMEAGKPNTGLKLPAEIVAGHIVSRETPPNGGREDINYGVLDPAAFAVISGPSIGETMGRHGVIFRRADNTRLSRDKRMGGFDQIRARLNGDPDGRPMFYAQASSMHLRRTMPIMQHSTLNAEDMDSDLEDHAVDELRYALMSRPYLARHERMEDKNPLLVENAMLSIFEQ